MAARTRVLKAYAGKDTGKTEVGEVEVKQSVVEDAEKNEY